MKNKFGSVKLLNFLPLCIVLAVCVLATISYGFSFSSNDDGLIRAIASGAYSGKPDAHLIYVMYPMGLLFKCLYSVFPRVPWYDIVMLLLHLLCWYLIIARSMRYFDDVKRKISVGFAATFLLMTLDFKYLVFHQYTVLAALMVATAVLFIVTKDKCGDSSVDSSIIMVLLLVALWLRKEAFLMGLPIAVLALGYHLIKVCRKKKAFFTKLGIMAALCGLSFIIDTMAYSSPEWKAFREYNQARTEVYDYFKFPEYESNKDAYEAEGISEAEYEVLAHYMDVSLNEEVSASTFEALSFRYDAIMKEWQQFYSVPKKIIKDTALAIIFNDVKPAAYVMFIACLLIFIIGIKKKEWLMALMAAGVYAYRVVFTAYFVSRGRFPERVSFGLFIIIAALVLGLLLMEAAEKKKSSFLSTYLVVILLVTSVVSLISAHKDKKDIDLKVAQFESIYAYCEENPDSTYLVNTYTIAPLTEGMFSYVKLPQNCLILGNWTSSGPLEKERMARAGVESFEKDMIGRKDVYLIERSDLGSEWLINYYQAKGFNPTVETVSTIDTAPEMTFAVWAVNE